MRYKFSIWLPGLALAALVTLLVALLYLAVQQDHRMSANDPQIALAEVAARDVQQGKSLSLRFPDSLDLTTSLLVFAVLYDNDGRPVWSNGQLDGRMPQIPPGVLKNAIHRLTERVTWQPRPGIRMATIVVPTGVPATPCLAVGRSLREAEARISDLGKILALGWVASMGIVAVLCLWRSFNRRPNAFSATNP